MSDFINRILGVAFNTSRCLAFEVDQHAYLHLLGTLDHRASRTSTSTTHQKQPPPKTAFFSTVEMAMLGRYAAPTCRGRVDDCSDRAASLSEPTGFSCPPRPPNGDTKAPPRENMATNAAIVKVNLFMDHAGGSFLPLCSQACATLSKHKHANMSYSARGETVTFSIRTLLDWDENLAKRLSLEVRKHQITV